MVENKAERNLEDWTKSFDELKKLIKISSDEDIERYITIAKKQSHVADEEKLRKLFYEMREED